MYEAVSRVFPVSSTFVCLFVFPCFRLVLLACLTAALPFVHTMNPYGRMMEGTLDARLAVSMLQRINQHNRGQDYENKSAFVLRMCSSYFEERKEQSA